MLSISTDLRYWFWDKGDKSSITPHFNTSEFTCPCSNSSCNYVQQRISVDLVTKLEKVRNILNIGVGISSGYRCLAHQEELAKKGYETAKGISQHSLGNAADIICKELSSIEPLLRAEFKAIGISRRFIHVDTRNDRERVWFYKS